jgi:hypothetical protein
MRDLGSTIDPGPTPQYQHLPRPIMYTCIMVVSLSALAAIAYPVCLPLTPPQYHIAVALLCFSLSTVTGLFLSVHVDFRGTWGPYALMLGGPGALWIVTLFVFSEVFPEKPMIPMPSIPPGELSYAQWLNQLDEVRGLFAQSEDEEIPNILGNIYYPGDNHTKPVHTTLQYVPAYFPNGQAVMLKHIAAGKNGAQLELYHRPRPSTLGSAVQDWAFIAKAGSFEPVGNGSDAWYRSESGGVDWYEITLYLEKVTAGDFFAVDTPKYINADSDEARVDFTLIMAQPLKKGNFSAWKVKPYPFSVSGEVPLLFKKRGDEPSIESQKLADFQPFLEWLEHLQERQSPNAGYSALLAGIDNMFEQAPEPDRSISRILSSQMFKSTLCYDLGAVKETIVFTYHW